MSPPHLVSLLIPAHSTRFFEPALASAVAQTYGNLEIVVGDDSPDGQVAAIVAQRGSRRVTYVRNPSPLGFHGNFAALFTAARGDYVKFLNHDDVLHPHCVARMVAAFVTLGERVALVASRRQLIDQGGAIVPDTAATLPLSDRDCVFNGPRFGDEMLKCSVNRIGEPTAGLFRRADVGLEGGTLFHLGEHDYTCLADMALWLRLLARGGLFYFAHPLSFIRVHSMQLQGTPEVGARCIAERVHLPTDARRLGFLADDTDHRAARAHGVALVDAALARPDLDPDARRLLEATRLPSPTLIPGTPS
ncbi:MAG: glycosyltransferase family 2 protein [Casimicrobiaceae bacterium]